jgi:hypothetical protein
LPDNQTLESTNQQTSSSTNEHEESPEPYVTEHICPHGPELLVNDDAGLNTVCNFCGTAILFSSVPGLRHQECQGCERRLFSQRAAQIMVAWQGGILSMLPIGSSMSSELSGSSWITRNTESIGSAWSDSSDSSDMSDESDESDDESDESDGSAGNA